jgi:hypothetical protein
MIIDPSKNRNRGDLINLNQKRKKLNNFFFSLLFLAAASSSSFYLFIFLYQVDVTGGYGIFVQD